MKMRLTPGSNRKFISSPASSLYLLWSLAGHLFKLKRGLFPGGSNGRHVNWAHHSVYLVECTDIVGLHFYLSITPINALY